jgi:hypothetical protein
MINSYTRLGTIIFSFIVSKISKSIKNDVRLQMEQLLYEAGKKEKKKSKIKRRKKRTG